MRSQTRIQGQDLLATCPDTVLAVDLDGTLIQTDMLRRGVAQILRTAPLSMFGLVLTLLRQGRPGFKQAVAGIATSRPADLPYNPHVVALARSWRAAGRKVALATAADETVAQSVAAHLGIFDAVHASTVGRNLKGRAKAAFLVQEYGDRGFVYVGDSKADLHVWKHAAGAAIACDSPKVMARLLRLGVPVQSVAMRNKDADEHG